MIRTLRVTLPWAASCALLAISAPSQSLEYDPGKLVTTDYLASAESNVVLGGALLPPGQDLDMDLSQAPIGHPNEFLLTGQASRPVTAITAKRVCNAFPSFVHKRSVVQGNEWKAEGTASSLAVVHGQQIEHVGGFSTTESLNNPTAVQMDADHKTFVDTTVPFDVPSPTHVDVWTDLMVFDGNWLQSATGDWTMDFEIYFDSDGNGEIDPAEPSVLRDSIQFIGNTGATNSYVSTVSGDALTPGNYILRTRFRARSEAALNGSVCGLVGWDRAISDLQVLAQVDIRVR